MWSLVIREIASLLEGIPDARRTQRRGRIVRDHSKTAKPDEGWKLVDKDCTNSAAATEGVKERTVERIQDPQVLAIFLNQRGEGAS